MKKPEEVVMDIEIGIKKKNLTKTAVCREVGIKNSVLSNTLKLGREGKTMLQKHIDAIWKAIDELPEGSR